MRSQKFLNPLRLQFLQARRLAGTVESDRFANERLEGGLVDFFAFMDADWSWLASGFFMFSARKFQIYFVELHGGPLWGRPFSATSLRAVCSVNFSRLQSAHSSGLEPG